MKRRILSMLLVIAMVLCMLPTVFAANSGYLGLNVGWALDDEGTLTISGNGPMQFSIAGSPFDGNKQIQKVIIEPGVTTIGEYAFYGCSSLTSVTIPDSVTTISRSAFYGCTSLTSVTIPDSVTAIEEYTFYGCSNLTSVTIPNSVTTIGNYSFRGCSSLTSVTIPNGVTTIGQYAFADCTKLTSVTIPNSLTTIGSSAFDSCTSLTIVTIPDSVTTIDGLAFYGCSSLRKITFEGDAPSFGDRVFSGVTATVYCPIGNSTWTADVKEKCTEDHNLTWLVSGNAKSLEIESLPKVYYYVNDKLDLSQLCVMATSPNGDRGEVPLDSLTISPCDMSTTGKKTVTLSYKDLSVSFDVFVHGGHTDVRLNQESYPESEHSKPGVTDDTQTISYAGAEMLILTFSQDTYVDSGDCIYVYDGNDNELAKYTYSEATGVTITVPGDTAKVRVTTDAYFNGYGYSFESITAVYMTHTQQSVGGKAATCTEPGYTSATVCGIGGELLSTQGTIAAKGHTGTVVCSVCGEMLVSGGDMDNDGQVTVTDMLKLKPLILAKKWTDDELTLGDLNNDGTLSVVDIMLIKSIILNQ